MPRTKREFIKVELRLFNDHRFFTLSEREQLIYVKLLSIMKQTRNKIPKKPTILIQYLRMNLSPTEIKPILRRIKRIFPKFQETRWFYRFENYDELYGDGTKKEQIGDDENPQKPGVEREEEVEGEKEREIRTPAEEIYAFHKREIKPGGRVDAIRSINKLLKAGITKEVLLNHTRAYKEHLRRTKKTDPNYFIQANNFFGRAERWKEFKPIESNLKPADPNCKVCKGTGSAYVETTSDVKVCQCRKK